MAGESTETESEEFDNNYEEMQLICRQAKRKLAETIKHLNASPNLDKRVQSLYALADKSGDAHEKIADEIRNQAKVLQGDSEKLEAYRDELMRSLKKACLSTRDTMLDMETREVFHLLGNGIDELRWAIDDAASKLHGVSYAIEKVKNDEGSRAFGS